MTRLDAFTLAIQNEIQSQNLYRLLANSFKNPDTAAMFHSLIPLEGIHEQKLRLTLAAEYPNENVTFDADALPQIKIGDIKDPLQVLEFAISREVGAAEAYHQLANASTEPELKILLVTLAVEEENHKELLMSEILRLQGAAIWFDPSELSGLVED